MNSKMIKNFLVGALALLSLLAGEAFAQATSASVAVSAVVPKACRFYTAPGAMTLQNGGGVIDPTSATPATGTSNIEYRCSNGVSPQFDIESSGTYASPKSANVDLVGAVTLTNLQASITVTEPVPGVGTGLGAGQNKVATIGGSIASANFSAAAPDSYSRTVNIAIQAQ